MEFLRIVYELNKKKILVFYFGILSNVFIVMRIVKYY